MKITQRHKLLHRLVVGQYNPMSLRSFEGWVSLSHLLEGQFIGQYNARIKELRETFDIEQRFIEGVSHYRLNTPRATIDFENLTIKQEVST